MKKTDKKLHSDKEKHIFRSGKNLKGKSDAKQKFSDEQKQALLSSAKAVETHCKKIKGYCFECPVAKFTQMCTTTPSGWNIKS